MKMRPIFWGLIFFAIGTVGWVISVVIAVVTLGAVKFLTYIFAAMFMLSLPVAGLFEFLRWKRRAHTPNLDKSK